MKEQETSAPLTLRDIAREAGVSLATVDRVLHNRPGVRADTVRRVKETIERNAFQPHVAAAELARGRARRFAFVMPSGPNLFMQQIQSYLGEMSGWLSARRLIVETIVTDVFDAVVLASRLESIGGDFDGVAIVALDHPRVREAINGLVDGGTKVVTLVSDVPSSRRMMKSPISFDANRCGPCTASVNSMNWPLGTANRSVGFKPRACRSARCAAVRCRQVPA